MRNVIHDIYVATLHEQDTITCGVMWIKILIRCFPYISTMVLATGLIVNHQWLMIFNYIE